MKVTPVQNYKKANYPDKERVKADPALLLTMPKRWLRNGAACAALATTTALLAVGCSTREKALQEDVPFFEHGDGQYAMLAGQVAPAAFLSEEEAFFIIQEEAGKQGIRFQQGTKTIDNLSISVTYDDYVGEKKTDEKDLKPLVLDGYDAAKKIGFEFVSEDDMPSLKSDYGGDMPFKAYSKALLSSVNQTQDSASIAVFYDPQTLSNSLDVDEAKLREAVREMLRAQVRDFLAWLKAQGIE